MISSLTCDTAQRVEQGARSGARDSKNVESRVVLTLRVDPARLVRSRFALSRLAELSCALEVLTHPERAPFARGWVAATRPRVDLAAIALVHALVEHESWYVPDFLVPQSGGYEPTLDAELAAVAATPPDVVCEQLALAFRIGPPPAAALERAGAVAGQDPRAPLPDVLAAALAGGGQAVARRAAAELRVSWQAVLAGSWPALRRVLDEDVRHRAARAGRDGLGEILDGLHPSLDWDGTHLTMDARFELTARTPTGVWCWRRRCSCPARRCGPAPRASWCSATRLAAAGRCGRRRPRWRARPCWARGARRCSPISTSRAPRPSWRHATGSAPRPCPTT